MRDSYMTELEDIVWSEYDQIDDHVVPHPHQRHDVRSVYQGDSLKTHQYGGAGVSDNIADCHTNMYVSKGKGERRVQQFMNSRDIMLQDDVWSRSAEGPYPTSLDNESNEAATNLASDNTKISSQFFNNRNTDSAGTDLSTDDLVISEGCGAVETESYDYPLGDIIQADNDLSFCEDKESNDLLYYGWPNIGNFEDVDRMFSNCDSTFGLGNAGNEDELNWFSSSHNTIDGSGDVLKSAFQFPCPESSTFNTIPGEDSSLKMDNTSSFVNDTNVNDTSLSYRSMSEALKDGDPDTIGRFTFTNESDDTYVSNGQFTPMQKSELNGFVAGGISTANHSKNGKYGMISFQKKQVKHRNKSEGKRKDRDLENSSSHIRRSNLRSDRMTMSSIHSSLTSPDTRQQKKSMSTTNTLAFPYTPIPYTSLDYIRHPGQTPVLSTASAAKSHSSGLTTHSPKDSSNASTHLRSMENLQRWPVDVSSIPVNGRNVSLQSQRGYYPSYPGTPVQVDLVVQTGTCDPISDPLQVQKAQRETENQNEIEGARVGTLEDADTSHVQGSSCMSSGLDEITQEASSFRQLQQVMEQLDIRTKLCIRDSLYRLARSAEQRHPYDMLDSNGGNDQDPNGAVAEGRHSGFLNIETDTNPIDRSIAHLLFHRPSDASVPDDVHLESNSMVQGSLTSPPTITTEKLGRNEETIGEANR